MGEQILLVEDNENLGYILKEYLKMNGFRIDWVEDGKKGLSKVKENSYDLCILDVMMPRMDGFALAKEIKELKKNTPFIFLTAKTLKVDQLKGFDLGADDYIVKPVDEELLIARIKAILNRFDDTGNEQQPDTFVIGSFTFEVSKRKLHFEETTQSLTPREADLLALFCKKKGELLTREYALKSIWGDNNCFNRRIMDVYISKLRNHLSADPAVTIENVHGEGFILSCEG